MLGRFRKFEGREVLATLGTVNGSGRPQGDEWLSGEIATYLCGPSKSDENKVVFLQLKTRGLIPMGRKLEVILSVGEAKKLATNLARAHQEASQA